MAVSLGRSRAIAPLNRKPRGNPAPIVMPKNILEWESLMRQVIGLAETRKDRRLSGLRKALAEGKSERVLRMMGIIHMGDLPRVFPAKD